MSKKLPWWKRAHLSVKNAWDKNLRPLAEPMLRMFVKNKADQELARFKRKHDL